MDTYGTRKGIKNGEFAARLLMQILFRNRKNELHLTNIIKVNV